MAIEANALLEPSKVVEFLRSRGVSFFTGVPDSLLKDICAYVTDHVEGGRHIIAANEGAAVALATGHYLATSELSLVYLQNSGLGNVINPLLSLADPDVYSIPMVLLVGWRGEPGVKDEPQHKKQGRVMLPMLEAMALPHAVLSRSWDEAEAQIDEACKTALERQTPYFIVAREKTFASYKLQKRTANGHPLTREEAIKHILSRLPADAVVVSTTGKASREVFEHRVATGEGHARDFLTVGAMGHCSQIALGISLRRPERPVYCLDGDGAVLMHMGSLAIIGAHAGKNYKHVVINNGAHESVGGQPTVAFDVDIPTVARACGYKDVRRVVTADELGEALTWLHEVEGPALLEVRVNTGARADLGRPTKTPIENRDELMRWLSS